MTIDEIYLNIGQSISTAIDESNWTAARLRIKVVGNGVVGYTGDYQVDNKTLDLSSYEKFPVRLETGSGNYTALLQKAAATNGTKQFLH